MKRAATYSEGIVQQKLDRSAAQDNNSPPGLDRRFSLSLYHPPRNKRQFAGTEADVQYPQRPAIALKTKGKELASRTRPPISILPPAPSPTSVSPVEEKRKRDSDNHHSSSTALRIGFITSYLLISFAILGLTLSLVLSSVSSPSPLLIYTLAVTCFSIVIFPTIILSGHRGLILFFGITVLLLLLTSALAIAFAMTPTGNCSNADYLTIHALTGGSTIRCQMVQAQCALLWIGLARIVHAVLSTDLAAFIGSSVLTYRVVTGEKVESGLTKCV